MARNYDMSAPWNVGVKGEQVLDLINLDVEVHRVQAGAGTGKTFGLKRRVLRLLHAKGLNEAPENVLVCAFNRVIARDLESEIGALLKDFPGLSLPDVKTVHSLCHALLDDNSQLFLEHEVEVMLYDVLVRAPSLSADYPTQPDAATALREHEAGKKIHGALITAVRGWLADHGAKLVGDVPRQVAHALSSGDLQGKWRHILIDEFQDLTAIEASVLTNLRTNSAQLVAVGDRKQSIYSFRGNAMGGLSALADLVSQPIHDGTMDECRRCPPLIVELGNALMAAEGEPLKSTLDHAGQLHRVWWDGPTAEAQGMAAAIAAVHKKAPKASHLVMVTRHQWGYALREALRSIDSALPVRTLFSEDVLNYWAAREAFIFLCLVGNPRDKVALRDWLSYRQHDNGKQFLAPSRNADAYVALPRPTGELSLTDALAMADQPVTWFHGVGKSHLRLRLIRLRDLLASVPDNATPAAMIESILNPSRWITYKGPHADEAHEDILRLKREALRRLEDKPNSELGEIARLLRIRIATREPIGEEGKPTVGEIRIGTLHGAKGVTADYVYLLGLCDEALPGKTPKLTLGLTAAQHRDEQRRLLYVSLTRAKKSLVLSRANWIPTNDAKNLGLRLGPDPKHVTQLHDTSFFADIGIGILPRAQPGTNWKGVVVAENETSDDV